MLASAIFTLVISFSSCIYFHSLCFRRVCKCMYVRFGVSKPANALARIDWGVFFWVCVFVCQTAHLHVRATRSKKPNSVIQKVFKFLGLTRRLWLQLSPWQRQPVESLCLKASSIISGFTAFISSRANTSINPLQCHSQSRDWWDLSQGWSNWAFFLKRWYLEYIRKIH